MTDNNRLIGFEFDQDDSEKDRRRKSLLNDPNYGIVLCFLEKFRSILDLPKYPLQLFEDHLVNSEDKDSPRLIDFHIALLKRLSMAKNAQRENFDAIVTKFAARFDVDDSEHLKTNGFFKADVHIKIRLIKNLLESQLDRNQLLKRSLMDKSMSEINSFPLGRDRFGVSYWLFMDTDCFVRLFRENIDFHRTWSNVAATRDELENFIKIFISDHIVRHRFPDWTIDHQPWSSLPVSKDFEQFYSSISLNSKEEDQTILIDHLNNDIPEQITQNYEKRKRILSTEENNDDDNRVLRRSSRLRKTTTFSTVTVESSNTKKRCTLKKKKTPSRSRRKPRSKRTSDDYLCLSTSSSNEYAENSSEDDYNSDDYLPNQSQIDFDNNFFELEQEEDQSNIIEQSSRIKTLQTSGIIKPCCTCSKTDRQDVLLICNDCSDAYHLECLHPVLLCLPKYEWFCPLCEHRHLSNRLIEKFKELLINFNQVEIKQHMHTGKKSYSGKIKTKIYSSDESLTASETEFEDIEQSINIDESLLSSSNIDKNTYSISSRGRHRTIRFDMKKLLEDHDNINIDSDTLNDVDEDYANSNNREQTNFNLQLPKKITRLFHRRDQFSRTNYQSTRIRTKREPSNLNDTNELNERLGSAIVYINVDGNSSQASAFVTNSKQVSGIVRRWNDVQRRSRFKTATMKKLDETIPINHSNENSLFSTDDNSLYQDHDSLNSIEVKNEDTSTIDSSSSKITLKKVDANFDRLTRDIQFALNDINTHTAMTKTTDRQEKKQTSKMHRLCSSKLFQSLNHSADMLTQAKTSTTVHTASSPVCLNETNQDQIIPTFYS